MKKIRIAVSCLFLVFSLSAFAQQAATPKDKKKEDKKEAKHVLKQKYKDQKAIMLQDKADKAKAKAAGDETTAKAVKEKIKTEKAELRKEKKQLKKMHK